MLTTGVDSCNWLRTTGFSGGVVLFFSVAAIWAGVVVVGPEDGRDGMWEVRFGNGG